MTSILDEPRPTHLSTRVPTRLKVAIEKQARLRSQSEASVVVEALATVLLEPNPIEWPPPRTRGPDGRFVIEGIHSTRRRSFLLTDPAFEAITRRAVLRGTSKREVIHHIIKVYCQKVPEEREPYHPTPPKVAALRMRRG